MESAIVLAHHGIGDLVMLLPSLEVARRAMRNVHFTVLVKDRAAVEFLDLVGLLGRNCSARPMNDRLLAEGLALRRQRPDYFVAPYDYGGRRLRWFRWFIRPRVSALSTEVNGKAGGSIYGVIDSLKTHKCVIFHECFRAIGCPPLGDFKLESLLPPNLGAVAEKQLPPSLLAGGYLAIAPGSGVVESHKRWPAKAFTEFANLALKEKLTEGVVFLGGTQERELIDEITKGVEDKERCHIPKDISLKNTLGLLQRAACLVTNCNGVSHLGALAGARIVGIYGPTNPNFTGPWTQRKRFVRLRLACSPCYRPEMLRGCGSPVCMDISAREVFRHVQKALNDEFETEPSWDANPFATSADPRKRGDIH